MQLRITRLALDERVYSITNENGTNGHFRDFELKQKLLTLGVGDSTIAAVLDMEPSITMVLQVPKAA